MVACFNEESDAACVTLSVTKAALVSGTQCAQDMLYVMRVLESMGLKVKKSMILHMDNKGAIDLNHNWSVGERTRHVDIWYYFLRVLKEENVIRVWILSNDNCSDIFTKNWPDQSLKSIQLSSVVLTSTPCRMVHARKARRVFQIHMTAVTLC